MNTLTETKKYSGKISDNVKIGSLVTPFQSVGKSPVIDKTAPNFDNANLRVNNTIRLYDANIACYIPGTQVHDH